MAENARKSFSNLVHQSPLKNEQSVPAAEEDEANHFLRENRAINYPKLGMTNVAF